ncbi:MAG: M20/M25/M40 family metallo-hydrolase [bacterium]|nr:M20/M25/M40 family metallo-hydrolase [bacterium]
MLTNTKNEELTEIFKTLVQIPSPTLSEEKVIEWILDFCKKNNINARLNDYKDVIIKVPATDTSKKPILLSSHMDVVGDFSPINLVEENGIIKTDGKRTLGADDKAGVSCGLLLAKEIANSTDLKHGGLEIVFTRDEEKNMTGIHNLDFSELEAKHVLVLDGDRLGVLEVSGASYTNARLIVTTPYGGHSGIDIHERHRLNAAKLVAELIMNIPQGVFYKDETGTITSINIGTIIAGNIEGNAGKIVQDQIKCDKYIDYFMENAITNIINTDAQVSYSIRSASIEKENELKALIQNIVKEFNEKYEKYAKAEVIFTEHLPQFERSNDPVIENVYKKATEKLGMTQTIKSFHAGAETHIYAKNRNKNGETFSPYLMGVANIYNMHSAAENIEVQTLIDGYGLVKEMFMEFNQ